MLWPTSSATTPYNDLQVLGYASPTTHQKLGCNLLLCHNSHFRNQWLTKNTKTVLNIPSDCDMAFSLASITPVHIQIYWFLPGVPLLNYKFLKEWLSVPLTILIISSPPMQWHQKGHHCILQGGSCESLIWVRQYSLPYLEESEVGSTQTWVHKFAGPFHWIKFSKGARIQRPPLSPNRPNSWPLLLSPTSFPPHSAPTKPISPPSPSYPL